MDTIMGNKFGKTIWLQRMIKMMDKIDNFRANDEKQWNTKINFYKEKRV